MVDRIPLFVDPANNQICEFEAGDTIDPSVDVGVDTSTFVTTADLTAALAAFNPLPIVQAYLNRSVRMRGLGEVNSVAGTFVEYMDHTFTVPEAATYKITTSYLWSLDNITTDFRARLMLDGTQVLWQHVEEPSDSAGATAGVASGTDQRYTSTYSEHILLPAGSHTLSFQYGPTANFAAAIYEADLSVERWLP